MRENIKGGKVVEFKDLEIFQIVAKKEQLQKQQKIKLRSIEYYIKNP